MADNGRHATLYDFRDLDLLLKLEDEANANGYVESAALAESLGLDGAISVTSRLSWMRRYGMLEFDEKLRMWRLTEGARRVTQAQLRAAHSTTLNKIPDESMVEVMAHVTGRWRHGDPMTAAMLRREFLFGTKRR